MATATASIAKVKDWVRMRRTQDYSSDIIAKLSPGTVVRVVKDGGKHYLINHDDKEGWVSKTFIVVDENSNKG